MSQGNSTFEEFKSVTMMFGILFVILIPFLFYAEYTREERAAAWIENCYKGWNFNSRADCYKKTEYRNKYGDL